MSHDHGSSVINVKSMTMDELLSYRFFSTSCNSVLSYFNACLDYMTVHIQLNLVNITPLNIHVRLLSISSNYPCRLTFILRFAYCLIGLVSTVNPKGDDINQIQLYSTNSYIILCYRFKRKIKYSYISKRVRKKENLCIV